MMLSWITGDNPLIRNFCMIRLSMNTEYVVESPVHHLTGPLSSDDTGNLYISQSGQSPGFASLSLQCSSDVPRSAEMTG